MSNISELENICNDLNISFHIINGDEANEIIAQVINLFNPEKITGHLSISNSNNKVFKISLEHNEFTYSKKLPEGKGYIFFDLESKDKNNIFVLDNVQNTCDIMSESFGMEYFLCDEKFNYLIAVNWYVIELTNGAKEYLIT